MENPSVTIAPPILSQILFVIVFGVILGTRIGEVGEYSYISFMFPGLVMMALLMNSYMNPSWSIYAARRFGWIDPILSSPLSYTQIVAAYVLAGVCRGLFVGLILLVLGLILPVAIPLFSPIYMLAYMLIVSLLAAGLGCIVGLWAMKFDHIALIMDFVLSPLIFLGGVFYSIKMIAGIPILEILVRVNPVTYMINGLRYGMIGLSELPVEGGLIMLSALAFVSLVLAIKLFRKGYHLRV